MEESMSKTKIISIMSVFLITIFCSSLAGAALAPPTITEAVSLSESQIKITWTDSNKGKIQFEIERGLPQTGEQVGECSDNIAQCTGLDLSGCADPFTAICMYYVEIATVDKSINTYTDHNLDTDTQYFYRLSTTKSSKRSGTEYSPYSNIANAVTEQVPFCGNSIVETGEQCDDGNSVSGDGCENNCTLTPSPVCGNSIVETGEQCDDGNSVSGDGCENNCTLTPSQTTPVDPSELTPIAVSSSQIHLTWKDNADNENGYHIWRYHSSVGWSQIDMTGASAGIGNYVSYSDTGLSSSTVYSYAVRAYNSSGYSGWVMSSSVTTLSSGDTTLPSVSITSPSSGSTYTTAQTRTINASASDNVWVTMVRFYDGATFKGTDTTSPYTYAWSFTSSDNGTHNWTAKAYDAAGNVKTSSAVSLTVNISVADTTAPSVPQNNNASADTCTQISLSWNASTDTGGSGLKGYNLYRGGAYIKQVASPATSSIDSGLSGATTYSYTARAVDNAGNLSGISNTAITNTPPCQECGNEIVCDDGIYADDEKLTPLIFNSKFTVQSDIAVTTTSSKFVDDPEAVTTFTLNDTQTVLVIYQSHNNENSDLGYWGIGNAISIDGVDHSKSYDTPSIPDQSARNQIFWIGSLGTGEHTIKGRFASPDNLSTVTVSDRILLIYIFDGAGFKFIESSVVRTTTSGELIDDEESIINFVPSENGKALYLYNINNATPSMSEWIAGKKAAISVSSVDYSQAEKSTNGGNTLDSIFTLHAEDVISQAPVTVQGRWASNVDTKPVRVDYSQLGVLFFDDSVLMDLVESDTQVSTSSDLLVDDTEATIQRGISGDMELLVVAFGTTRVETESDRKLNYGISVDSVDRKLSRASSDGVGAFSNSAATSWGESLSPGFHTIQGRFSSGGGIAHGGTYVDSRRMIALWFNNSPTQ
jgi:cysteine-rich repeat protein